MSAVTPKMLIEVDFSESGLSDPPINLKADTFGVWPEGTVFPSGRSNYVPPDLNDQVT